MLNYCLSNISCEKRLWHFKQMFSAIPLVRQVKVYSVVHLLFGLKIRQSHFRTVKF